jgi:hypothetical protein
MPRFVFAPAVAVLLSIHAVPVVHGQAAVSLASVDPSIAGQVSSPVIVSDIRVNIDPTIKIGSVRSGIVCAPNGVLKWHQIAMPRDEQIREAIVARLSAAGRAVQPGGDGANASAAAKTVVRLSIDGAAMSLCTAWMGLGKAPKAKGTIKLTWHVKPPSSAERSLISEEKLVFDHRDPRVDATVILDAIAASAVEHLTAV